MSPFVLSIEYAPGKSFKYGFHLGKDARLARQIAEERFYGLRARGEAVVTVALMRDQCVFDCFDGLAWDSERDLESE